MTAATMLTYPARPVSAGLNIDKPFTWNIPGTWKFEPKVNGWRLLVYLGGLEPVFWNRQGELSSVANEFGEAAAKLKRIGVVWADCEALERRHNIGKGSLVVLDVLWTRINGVVNREPYWKRRGMIRDCGEPIHYSGSNCKENGLYHLPHCANADMAGGGWELMKTANKELGVPFWEGFVAKKYDSLYPLQVVNPNQEFTVWVKKRFLP